jgi:hypothetical protein
VFWALVMEEELWVVGDLTLLDVIVTERLRIGFFLKCLVDLS